MRAGSWDGRMGRLERWLWRCGKDCFWTPWMRVYHMPGCRRYQDRTKGEHGG